MNTKQSLLSGSSGGIKLAFPHTGSRLSICRFVCSLCTNLYVWTSWSGEKKRDHSRDSDSGSPWIIACFQSVTETHQLLWSKIYAHKGETVIIMTLNIKNVQNSIPSSALAHPEQASCTFSPQRTLGQTCRPCGPLCPCVFWRDRSEHCNGFPHSLSHPTLLSRESFIQFLSQTVLLYTRVVVIIPKGILQFH